MNLNRRDMLAASGGLLMPLLLGPRRRAALDPGELRRKIERLLAETGGVGIACAIVGPGRTLWAEGFGLADRERQRPMTPDTLLNVASVSKTVTATAAMQLWEEHRFKLEDDVAPDVPFPIRHPRFPDVPITFAQLLTHRSSIKDGPAYFPSYACGDPALSLKSWLEAYFTPGGRYWDAGANWHDWPPGTVHPPSEEAAYSNIGYGVLGYLVEVLAGEPFEAFCRARIFRPLGMDATGWFLREVDVSRHATPYARVSASMTPAERGLFETLAPTTAHPDSLAPGALAARCLYSFPNYPDGSLRTSANDLARFLATFLNGGRVNNGRIMAEGTIETMLSGRHFGQHLCWHVAKLPDGRTLIQHAGGDPGVSTHIGFDPASRIGVVSLRNWELVGEPANRLTTLLLDAGMAMR